MAERRPGRTESVRLRTTAVAVVVVAIALAGAAAVLVALLRDSMTDRFEDQAKREAEQTAAAAERLGPSAAVGAVSGERDPDEGGDAGELEADETAVFVRDATGATVAGTEPGFVLPDSLDDSGGWRYDGDRYTVAMEPFEYDGAEFSVVVIAGLEDVQDATDALVPLLLVGTPLVLLVVGGTTWWVTGLALRPVERIRAQVETISSAELDRRVPVPGSRDELHRLAITMNQMLARLEESRDRQRRFVSDASHELRSPIASLRQVGEVAHAHPEAFDPRELAGTVVEESVRMQHLVEQLLTLTRHDESARTNRWREVDLDDLVLAEADRLRRTGVSVSTAGLAAARVRGDEVALTQVVRNLTDNAARHARSTVWLALSAGSEQDGDPTGDPTGDPDGGGVTLTVDDDGAGIPEADRARAFERFVRLDEARARDTGGSGLGLSIVADLVRSHGGTVRAEASEQGGARFVVRLPAAAGPTEPA